MKLTTKLLALIALISAPLIAMDGVDSKLVQKSPLSLKVLAIGAVIKKENSATLMQKLFRPRKQFDAKSLPADLQSLASFIEKHRDNFNRKNFEPIAIDAITQDQTEILSELLAMGLDPDTEVLIEVKNAGNQKVSLLALSIGFKKPNCFDLLLNAGVSVHQKNEYGLTPLAFACCNKGALYLEPLIQAGADLNTPDHENFSPLMKAICEDDVDCVIVLLKAGARLDFQNNEGATALMLAAHNGHFKCLQKLIEAGAQLDLGTNQSLSTALMFAMTDKKKPECLEALLEAGASIDLRNNIGASALMNAAYLGNLEYLNALIKNKADINQPNNRGETALEIAAYQGHASCVKRLIEAGARLDVRDNNGKTALMIARDHKQAECAELLEWAAELLEWAQEDILDFLANADVEDYTFDTKKQIDKI